MMPTTIVLIIVFSWVLTGWTSWTAWIYNKRKVVEIEDVSLILIAGILTGVIAAILLPLTDYIEKDPHKPIIGKRRRK